MSTTVNTVASSDTIDAGRVKWNANDDTLAAAVNSLASQAETHVANGHPSLYYTKSEDDAQQNVQDEALEAEAATRSTAITALQSNIDTEAATRSTADTALQSNIDTEADTVNGALTTHKSSTDHDAHNDGRYDVVGTAAAVSGALTTHKSSNDHDAHNDTRNDARYDALGAASTVNTALTAHKSSTDHDAHNDGRYDVVGAAAAVSGALTTHKSSNDHDAHNDTRNDARYDTLGAASTVNTALTAHKSSGDHDARYASLASLASFVRLTTDQAIDGIKTFLRTIYIKGVYPALELILADGSPGLRLRVINTNGVLITLIENAKDGVYKILMENVNQNDYVDFPYLKVRSQGKELATQEYVANQIDAVSAVNKSFSFRLYKKIAGYSNNNPIPFSEPDGDPLYLVLPGAILKKVIMYHGAAFGGEEDYTARMEFAPHLAFNNTAYPVRPEIVRGDISAMPIHPTFRLMQHDAASNDDIVLYSQQFTDDAGDQQPGDTDKWIVFLYFEMT
jgi:hypothetical protein